MQGTLLRPTPEQIEASRRDLPRPVPPSAKAEAEGGCGVIGLVSSRPVAGKHIVTACSSMRNRGNGKGGGLALAGLDAAALGVSQSVLETEYLLAVAYLEPAAREQVEASFIRPFFDVSHSVRLEALKDFREAGLDVAPPEVRCCFARVKPAVLDAFIERHNDGRPAADRLERERWEDEFVSQNSYRLNAAHYASLGRKSAFVLSHAKNLLVLKLVGYAEDVIAHYRLSDLKAHLWIGHQRYPTKGRVWHPGGAHPFIGMHEALVHNGDFANYARVSKYLRQRGVGQLFLTDTEVSVQLFDLWSRVYRYPLEHVIEAMAPTTERDFDLLPPSKQKTYRAVQSAHIKGSPDGPWFFILARSEPWARRLQLLGITDTSMLRPQVFALQDRPGPDGRRASIGLIASEKQAIDATLASLAAGGEPFDYPADRYWNARGGSHTDGGAFSFTLHADGRLLAADKFGVAVSSSGVDPKVAFAHAKGVEEAPALEAKAELSVRAWEPALKGPAQPDGLLHIDAAAFPIQGPQSAAAFLVFARTLGWKRFAVTKLLGHRFLGSGFGPASGVELDLFGSPGDYLGSGFDGGVLRVYNSAQDQVGQIFKSGRLVVYGDVGQTFFYGAKGGDAFILGDAAGRPLINAVGRPRVVINGTCLDYLAESFMAGDPLAGGGFAVVNGVRFLGPGQVEPLETPYPGGNLFSLASGGAIYLRDPLRRVGEDQLNGGRIADLEPADWDLIRPYLEENERLFGIPVRRLLTHSAQLLSPREVYVKVVPTRLRALSIAHD